MNRGAGGWHDNLAAASRKAPFWVARTKRACVVRESRIGWRPVQTKFWGSKAGENRES